MRFLKSHLHCQNLTGQGGKLSSAYFGGIAYAVIEEWRLCASLFLVIITISITSTLLVLVGNVLYPKEPGNIDKKRDTIVMTAIS